MAAPASSRSLLLSAAALVLASATGAQSNAVHGIDVSLGGLGFMVQVGHQGSVGQGVTAVAMTTTSCNVGAKIVPWEAAMDPDHPFIAFLVARERDGRLEQISNLSHVKHGFFALANSLCTPCQGGDPAGQWLGLGCSDTYSVNNNADNFWLGPQQEIDPWLGEWDPVCSFFDAGLTPKPLTMCDGQRSYTTQQSGSLGPIGFRVAVQDEDFDDPDNARFFYQAHYVIEHESESVRGDNLGSREFTLTSNALGYDFQPITPMQHGSVLTQWNGASITSAKNGGDDGRFFVGVSVTGPEEGLYHYEYAVHNRDNNRAGGAFRLPVCAGAQVSNVSFSDIDSFGGNDWDFTNTGSELVWSSKSDPLRWNSIFNFSFDSDAAPEAGSAVIEQFFPGPGAPTLNVATSVPTALHNVTTGPGCSLGVEPVLFASGAPAQATLGNASFGLTSTGNDPSAIAVVVAGSVAGSTALGGGCSLQMGGLLGTQIWIHSLQSFDAAGELQLPLPIPANAAFEGAEVHFQLASQRLAGGPYLGQFDLSNGLLVRVGDSTTSCP